ncbi:MAG: MFS transporter [Chloroflexi bacterium]|nr:MFS transporter [Chloroflexota bacterium]
MNTQLKSPFVRDRFTWLAYFMLAYFGYLQAVLGPVMPFLRDELALSYTVGGLHFSALALGMVMSGLVSDAAIRRWGRPAVFWGGGGGMALGAAIVVLGPHEAFTIFGAWVMGFLGTLLLTAIQSSLADHHGPNRAYALTEANAAASFSAGLAPLLVGGFALVHVSWRGALVAAVLAWGSALLFMRQEPVPPAKQNGVENDNPAGSAHRLPRVFWFYWVGLVLGVAAEWSFVAWGADFLVNARDLAKADASLIMTLFFVAMVTGRTSGSRLTHRYDAAQLMVFVIGLTMAGFLLFWLVPIPALSVVGLFIGGLGAANLFPFMLTISVSINPDLSDMASARVALGAGMAILLAPQTLGTVADQTGIETAYGLVPVILVVAAGVVLLANRLATSHNLPSEQPEQRAEVWSDR